ncbi:hypothetical protein NDU88_005566 [Pleurodeles waltl]|uniref:Uncharacterized protein n=1 Tax=Pleurodeles waltl TaxID=8319 RepID=A0AAV7LLT8_PLEWA|nr:hypothetical protein NDU88_005566 [Pleurodeles waltl]
MLRVAIHTWRHYACGGVRSTDDIMLRVAIRTWRHYACGGVRSTPYTPSLPLWAMPECAGLKAAYRTRDWEEVGIRTWADVMSDEGLHAFKELSLEYRLGPEQFMLYSALRGLMRKTWGFIGSIYKLLLGLLRLTHSLALRCYGQNVLYKY